MKCINKSIKMMFAVACCCMALSGCAQQGQTEMITEYESEQYRRDLYRGTLFADGLCVSAENVGNEQIAGDTALHGAGLFGLNEKEVLYSYQIYDRCYPASTTKILTALLAIESGRLDEVVTVGANAVNVPADSSKAWLQLGDRLTLRELLYGLMLPSGNDAAVAIAEHLAGSEAAFAEQMNQRAAGLGATNSHFVNSNGYQNENHYTTAYDMYLIFNECITHQEFLDVIASPEHLADITMADGQVRQALWKQSNQFVNKEVQSPENVMVIGGKTGTTDEAGACLILYSRNAAGAPYVSVVMGAASKPVLYSDMSSILSAVPAS